MPIGGMVFRPQPDLMHDDLASHHPRFAHGLRSATFPFIAHDQA